MAATLQEAWTLVSALVDVRLFVLCLLILTPGLLPGAGLTLRFAPVGRGLPQVLKRLLPPQAKPSLNRGCGLPLMSLAPPLGRLQHQLREDQELIQ